jgi:hypothetical protein
MSGRSHSRHSRHPGEQVGGGINGALGGLAKHVGRTERQDAISELGPAFSAMEDDPDVRCGVLSPPGSNSIKSHSKKLAASDESTRLRNCR